MTVTCIVLCVTSINPLVPELNALQENKFK